MAPRQDRTHPLVFGHSATTNARLTSTKGGYYSYGCGGCGGIESGFRGLNDFGIRDNMFFDLLGNVNFEPKKKNILNNNNLLNKRKVRFNLAHRATIQERKHKGSLQERDEIRALEKEAIMYKLKRQEIQAQTRELRRELYKKNQEIRRKKREVKCLKALERDLIRFLDKCDNQSADIQQPLSNNLQIAAVAPSAFRANLYRIYVLCAALFSFLLVRVVSYGSIVVNRV